MLGEGRPAKFSTTRLLINHDYALLWAGQAVSVVGDLVFDTTLILWIAAGLAAHQSWAPLAVSGVLLAAAIPQVAIAPLAGVFVDRWDKRRTMLRMDAIRVLIILLLLLTAGTFAMPVWAQLGAIYAAVVLATTCAQFFNPARLALIGDLVAEPDRTRASSLQQLTANLAVILGPALAAPLYFGLGARWALLVNALSFAISFATLILIRYRPSSGEAGGHQRSFRQDYFAGLRFFAGNRVLVTVLVSMALVMLGYGAVTALNVFFLQQNLHAAAHWYGLFGVASGAGAIVGTVVVGSVASRLVPLRTLWVSLLIVGSLDLVYARLTSLPAALLVLFLTGFVAAAFNVTIIPVVLLVTPREFVGRVAAVLTPVISLASMVSVVLAGYLASTLLRGLRATLLGVTFGPIDTIYSVTGLLTLVSGVYAMLALRGVVPQAPAVPGPATEVAGSSGLREAVI